MQRMMQASTSQYAAAVWSGTGPPHSLPEENGTSRFDDGQENDAPHVMDTQPQTSLLPAISGMGTTRSAACLHAS